MTKHTKKRRAHQTARIYYGPPGHETSMWWKVRVTDARKAVTINGSVMAALKAYRGVTIGCALSMAAMQSAKQFGHPAYFISVTKSTMLVVDRLYTDGSPQHAIRYAHSYGSIVDKNDDGSLKSLVKNKPEIMERPFHLRPPRIRHKGGEKTYKGTGGHSAHKVSGVPHRGALRRAVKAGRMSEHVAAQLIHVVAETNKEKVPATPVMT